MLGSKSVQGRGSAVGALIVLISLVLGVTVSGYLAPRGFLGSALHQIVEGDFSSDAWVGQNATITVPGFASVGNSIELGFNPVRPGATEPALIGVTVCGGKEQELSLASRDMFRFQIPFGCSPVSLTVRALNFFSPPGERDGRTLGAQLRSVRIVSPLRIPFIEPVGLLLACLSALGVLLLAARVGLSFGLPPMWGPLVVVALVAALVFGIKEEPGRYNPVFIVLASLLAGMALYAWRRDSVISEQGGVGKALLGLALVLGAALRLYGISFGLPANFHPDEVPKVNAIMRMVDQGMLDPQYFLHPSLLLYSTYAMNTVLHFFGISGEFRDTAFLAGRLVSTTAGVISIALTYAIGRRLLSAEAGGIGALLLAVFPLHVTCSRYLKEDALLTFVVLSCVLVTTMAVQSKRRWLLLIAGLLAGCTAGTKYSGILMAVVPASAPWMVSRSWKPDLKWLPWAVFAVALAPVGFLMTTPYALLNSAKFLRDFDTESRHMQNGHTVSITAWSQFWMYHFWRSIWPGLTSVASVVSVVALGFLVRRARLEDLVVVGIALLFYLPAEYVKAKPAPQPERYILPCLPFIAIAVGELIRVMRVDRVRLVRGLAYVCALAVVLFPLGRTVELARDLPRDTRDQLAEWMKTNVPHGSKILMDWKPYCPNFQGAYFEVEHIPRARIIPELDVRSLRSSGADYLILSSLFYNRYFSQPEGEPILRQRFREVFQRVPIVAQFEAESGTYGFHNPTLTLFSLKAEDFERLEYERLQKQRGEIEYTSNEVRARAKW